jgi:hypothetical protein
MVFSVEPHPAQPARQVSARRRAHKGASNVKGDIGYPWNNFFKEKAFQFLR